MIPKAYLEIINMLVARTSREEVDWKPTSNENIFIVNFPGFSLSMSYGKILISQLHIVDFIIRDSEGMKVDSFRVEEGEPDWEKALGLYSKARKQALKIDKAIAVISDELKKAKKVGSAPDK